MGNGTPLITRVPEDSYAATYLGRALEYLKSPRCKSEVLRGKICVGGWLYVEVLLILQTHLWAKEPRFAALKFNFHKHLAPDHKHLVGKLNSFSKSHRTSFLSPAPFFIVFITYIKRHSRVNLVAMKPCHINLAY